jgi:hypothetical protein
MKRTGLILMVLLVLFSCTREEQDVNYYNQMISISEPEIKFFVSTLPLFYRLSTEVKKGIDQRLNSDEQYREYIKALGKHKKFKSEILGEQFRDMEHYMLVSFNVYQAHSYVVKMGTNYQDLMKKTYSSLNKKQLELRELESNTNTGVDTNIIYYRKTSLQNEYMQYSNMLLVQPYSEDINKILLELQ